MEKEIKELIEKLEKQKLFNEGYIGHPDHKDVNDYHVGGTTAYGFCIDELKKIINK